MNKRKIIIDTDPGIDDLMALSVAGALEELDILAFSTVHGNVSLEHTTRNAQLISDLLKLNIPIIKGAHKPLFYDKKEVSPVHGKDGLANMYDHFRAKVEIKNNIDEGVKVLLDLIDKQEEKVTIIALGPLTNIAKLILLDEDIKDKVDEIHVMGGGFGLGNINELTEFNFYSDSHAARIVLNSGIPIVLSPLDLTHKIYFTEEEFSKIEDSNDKLKFIKQSVEFYISFDPYMHDVCSVLTLVRPDLFDFESVDVGMVIGGGIADGQSYRVNNEPEYKVRVADTSKREEIIKTVFEILNEKYRD